MTLTYKGREVELADYSVDISEGTGRAEAAYYTDTDVDLTDEELDELSDLHSAVIFEEGYSHAVNKAHELFEGMER